MRLILNWMQNKFDIKSWLLYNICTVFTGMRLVTQCMYFFLCTIFNNFLLYDFILHLYNTSLHGQSWWNNFTFKWTKWLSVITAFDVIETAFYNVSHMFYFICHFLQYENLNFFQWFQWKHEHFFYRHKKHLYIKHISLYTILC
jgi:hypothetical protein